MQTDNFETDVLIIGAGMAGLTAAAYAALKGVKVLVVEKAPTTGGSAALSEGYIWTAPTVEALSSEDPDGDHALGRTLVLGYDDAISWVQTQGVSMSKEITGIYGFGRGRQIDILRYLEVCERTVERLGGNIIRNCQLFEPSITASGEVTGASLAAGGSEQVRVIARQTIIASGGFQGNPDLLERFIGSSAGQLKLRSNPYSTGDGLLFGLAAGGRVTPGIHGYYGHLIPSPLPDFSQDDYVRLAFLHSGFALLLNNTGKRFTDESLGDHRNAQAVLSQPLSRAVLVCDDYVRREKFMSVWIPGMSNVDKIAAAAEAGGRVISASTLSDLANAVTPWGLPGETFLASILDYNAHANSGSPLSIPSSRWARPLNEPPFYALEVQPAITFTYCGLAADPSYRVLGSNGPIPGLLVAGVDVGGLYASGYAGGLARALVSGLRSAQTATTSASDH
jgi:succinate dehydrogenase/fumarate reductase flavoprotein subunit